MNACKSRNVEGTCHKEGLRVLGHEERKDGCGRDQEHRTKPKPIKIVTETRVK